MFAELVSRAVAMGATLGLPASEAELAAAEARLGVRFDAQYRELMSICSGIEGIGGAFLFPADELGTSPRWLALTRQLEIEYFDSGATFETRGDETVDLTFYPAPPGRGLVLIGEDRGVNTPLVCSFSESDPDLPPGEIAGCFYEPDILGVLTETLTYLMDNEDAVRAYDAPPGRTRVDPVKAEQADVFFQIGRLFQGINAQNRAQIRHTLSLRWRSEFDRLPGQPGLNMLRRAVLWGGAVEPVIDYESYEYELGGAGPHWVRAMAAAPVVWQPQRRRVEMGVVKENTVWRIDSWSWSALLN